MYKRLLVVIFFLITFFGKSQCPPVYDYLNNLTTTPYWLSCSGSTLYTLNFQSNTSFGTYTIVWGDATPNFTAPAYVANSIINHTFTSASPDTFVVNLIVPSLGCTLTGVVVMEQAVNASVTLPIGGTNTACGPATLQFLNSSTNVSETTRFLWNFGDGTPPVQLTYTNGGTNVSHLYSVGAVNCQTQVTLQAWNYCSLGATTTATYSPVQIFQKDSPTIIQSAVIQCSPNNVFTFSNGGTLNCSGQGNTFQRKVQWNFGNYWGMPGDSIYPWVSFPPSPSITISYTSIGTYSILLSDSNVCGVSNVIANVIIMSAPNASVVAPNSICAGVVKTYTNASSPGYSYLWDWGEGGGFVNLGAGNKTHTYNTPGSYTLQLQAFIPGSSTCVNLNTVQINVLPNPTSNFTFNPVFGCNTLSNVSFTNTSVGATIWNWNFGNGNTSTLQVPPNQNYISVGAFTVSLVATSVAGCVDTETALIVVHPSPVAGFTNTGMCVGSAVNFTNTSIVTGTNALSSYTWNFGDLSPTVFTQNATHTFVTASTFSITLTVSDAFCSSTVTNTISVNAQPNASFVPTPSVGCSPLSVNFSTLSGVSNYTWNFGDGTPISNAINPTHVFSNTTLVNQTFTVNLIAANVFGCLDTSNTAFLIFNQPTASYTFNPSSGCSPLVINFTNTSVGTLTNNWIFNNGTSSVLQNPSATFTNSPGSSSSSFSVILKVTNAGNCKDSIIHSINLFSNPKAIFNLDTPACSPKLITFTNTSIGATTYSWNFGTGAQSTSSNPTHNYVNAGVANQNYTVTLIANSSNGCLDSVKVPFILHPEANYAVTASIDSGCAPLKVNFPAVSGAVIYQWNFGDGNSSALSAVSNTFLNATTSTIIYTVNLIAKSSFGCADTAKKTIKIFPKPNAFFTTDLNDVIANIQPVQFLNASTGGQTFNWSFGDGGSSVLESPLHTYTLSGEFTATLITISNRGCKDTFEIADKIMVRDEASIKVPNAFSPNTSGSNGPNYSTTDLNNDVFHAVCRGVNAFEMSIFSRWGELLFKTENTAEGWDGYFKGKLCSKDIYVWKISATFIDGTKFNKAGDLLLIR